MGRTAGLSLPRLVGCCSLGRGGCNCPGLTILAYRYEGLRRSDLLEVLRGLREQMAQETGPYRTRPACRTFVRWVELAGARVRGTRRIPPSEARQRDAAAKIQARTRGNQARLQVAEKRVSMAERISQAADAASTAVSDALVRSAPARRRFATNIGRLCGCTSPQAPEAELAVDPVTEKSVRGKDAQPPKRSVTNAARARPARETIDHIEVLEPAAPSLGDEDIWPLQVIDLGDDEQVGTLFELLASLPHLVVHYLDTIICTACRDRRASRGVQ